MVGAWCRSVASAFVAVLLLSAPLFAQQSTAELVAAGRDHCGKREWAAAIALLDRALAQAPDDREALRWRGHDVRDQWEWLWARQALREVAGEV